MKTTITIVAACCMLISCTKENITAPSSMASHSADKKVTQATAFYIGQHYGGGIIFYIDSTGAHGLIAAKEDQGIIGYGSDIIRTDARGRAIGKGFINTVKIINAYGKTGNYAALLCAKYRGGGYEGWFLPSLQELEELYKQKNIVGGFSDNYYWASTEVSWDWSAAWEQIFVDGIQASTSGKWQLNSVRAVRAF